MSNLSKKPAQIKARKVKNHTLLPAVLQTDPNKKMLDSTLDAMTSKGQLLPFKETYGTRTAAAPVESFFKQEKDEIRREASAGYAIVSRTADNDFISKTSYLDLENYFRVKGLELKDGTQLDQDILTLDLPINYRKLTDYHLYYWLDADLPIIRLHADPLPGGGMKYSIRNDIIGKPYITIIDDISGKQLELFNGMKLCFTGHQEAVYKSDDPDQPRVFCVEGVGTAISLVNISNYDERIPTSYLKKRPWDKWEIYDDPPAIKWDSEEWDGSALRLKMPEYVVMERYDPDLNPWSVLDRWYHITIIREVAKFLDIDVDKIAKPGNQARRPIISFFKGMHLWNWPRNPIGEIKSILPGAVTDYLGKKNIVDTVGYRIKNGDRVVFAKTSGVYTLNNTTTSLTATKIKESVDYDGALITSVSEHLYHRVIFKNGQWSLAQNKTEPNQDILFEFYKSDGTSLESVPNINFRGGVVLGFKPGNTWDPILQKNVTVSNIDFDVINEENPMTVGSNQIKFYTDIDRTFIAVADNSLDNTEIKGPYGFKYQNNIKPFYVRRQGLDATPQLQDFQYEKYEDSVWTADIVPATQGFREIHVYPDTADELKFYFNLEGHGLVPFTTRRTISRIENFLPLVSDGEFKIVCHDLPFPLTLMSLNMVDNLTRHVPLAAPFVENNGISNGVIKVNLNYTYDNGTENVINPYAIDDTRLAWQYRNRFRIAISKPIEKWRFITSAYYLDKTNPIYHDYDFTITDKTNYLGELDYLQKLTVSSDFIKKAKTGDKIGVESYLYFKDDYDGTIVKTAPQTLKLNPLNQLLSDINYYSLYQHGIYVNSAAPGSREVVDPLQNKYFVNHRFNGGTLVKHNNPLARTALMATNFPFDFGELLIKQGRHYDQFMTRLMSELDRVVKQYDTDNINALSLLDLALQNIYLNQTDNQAFWYHSNMLGWGTSSYGIEFDCKDTNLCSLISPLEPISFEAGKETLLHLELDNKILLRNRDYRLVSDVDGYYTSIEIDINLANQVALNNKKIIIRQWPADFESRIPASLAKIGLAPCYQPEIYRDHSYRTATYFLIRHDGTRYYLTEGVGPDNYPVNHIESLLYEFEKAVWSSIAHDVEKTSHASFYKNMSGGFRSTRYNRTELKEISNNEMYAWMQDIKLYSLLNTTYDNLDPFTHVYQVGTGDDGNTLIGSWRAIYKHFYDTDRPHTHPWEMLGYTIKPVWWDQHYSWTIPSKRQALEKALRMGNVAEPPVLDCKPWLARSPINGESPLEFPVDTSGNLLPPTDLPWLTSFMTQLEIDWQPGYYSPYEMIFLSTQRGLASLIRTAYLANPADFVNTLWVPGKSYYNEWNQRLDSATDFWLTPKIEHDYHRSVNSNGSVNFTAGIESLFSEFCVLSNKDFKASVLDILSNTAVNKEFLLSGFTNKNNVRIQSTSANSQSVSLFVPEENYQVKTLNHYPEKEEFYSAVRVIWNGTGWNVYGFVNERNIFRYYKPNNITTTSAIKVGDYTIKEKNSYVRIAHSLRYGSEFTDRQELYDFLVGYGKYLEDNGFAFDDVEAGDIRNWQLSAKQFIFWSNDPLEPGNYIDLNPASDGITLKIGNTQLYNLVGTDINVGQVVDRFGKPIFSKDLLVARDDPFRIKTKNNNPIYGIKLVFVTYESVLYLEPKSIFNDTYFLPEQGTTKRSFVLGGKKSQDWTGKYQVPGYVFSDLDLVPNYDTLSEVGRNLLDVENVLNDTTILEASRAQFGLNKNTELRQLFIQESNEALFKLALAYNKGTKRVFNNLEPLTHRDGSKTIPYEEYMVRLGEFGNTKNIEFYEFQLRLDDIVREPQVIKFERDVNANNKFIYINDNSDRWIYRPYGKNLRFKTFNNNHSVLQTVGPILRGDTDYVIKNLDDIDQLYTEYEPLWSIKHYDETAGYKPNDLVRHNGILYYSLTTVSPGTWANNSDKFNRIEEPYLPNIFVENYGYQNPDLIDDGFSRFTPGTWQVLQTVDREVGIIEACPGPTDNSKARIYTNKDHMLKVGDKVILINAETPITSANGIWTVVALDETDPNRKFYINTYVTDNIRQGKLFTLKPVRFKTVEDLDLATEENGYAWKKKFNPKVNAIGTDYIEPPRTASGYSSVHPIAIIDDATGQQLDSTSYDYGNYTVLSMTDNDKLTVKTESLSVDPSNIEQLIIYDHFNNKTLIKVDLFDPKKLKLHKALTDDIDVISRVDPAKYNRTTDKFKSVYTSMGWYEEQLGKRWWDTSTIKFTDYESGPIADRVRNWGSTIDNKLPDIYEWTKSDVPPSRWAEKDQPGEVYVDNSTGVPHYSWVEEQEFIEGTTVTVYYFWVKNKDSIPEESIRARTYSTLQLSKILLNPAAAGLAWWAPISNDAMVIKGVEKYLNNDSTVVQIKMKERGEEKHQQWLFVSENNPICVIPEWMHIRFRDSLATFANYRKLVDYELYRTDKIYYQSDIVSYNDKIYVARRITLGAWNGADWQEIPDLEIVGNNKFALYQSKDVPDRKNLHPFNRYGNEIRPYIQSWFTAPLEARRTFIKRINELLLNMDLIYSVETWNRRIGQTNFVYGDRLVDMTKIWYYADFVSPTYDKKKPIVLTVETQEDVYGLNLAEGEYVKVLESGAIYEKVADGGFNAVYRKNGTIQFIKDLYDPISLGGWDIPPWDNLPWDYDLNTEIAIIVEALRYDIFVSRYEVNYNNMMCSMLRYVLSEQTNVNWVMKSSIILPYNIIGQNFENQSELTRDNVDVLQQYYNTVKAYRDKNKIGNINKNDLETADVNMEEIRLFDIRLRYNRNNYGNPEVIGTTVTGTNFVPQGWDSTIWDISKYPFVNINNAAAYDSTQQYEKFDTVIYDGEIYIANKNTTGPWDSADWQKTTVDMGWDSLNSQAEFDRYIQKVYQGYAGVPADSLDLILSGTTNSRFYRSPNDEEAMDIRMGDNTIINVTQTGMVTVREHYVDNTMSAFMLTSLVQLEEPLNAHDTHIKFTAASMKHIPDASLENPGAIWVGNERVVYTAKTSTGVTGLIRGSLGTTFKEYYPAAQPVYVVNAQTLLHDYTPLQSLDNTAPFYNDLGKTLEDSENPTAKRIVNYVGS